MFFQSPCPRVFFCLRVFLIPISLCFPYFPSTVFVYADIVLNHKMGSAQNIYWQAVRVEQDNRNVKRWWDGFESGLIEIEAYTKYEYPDKDEQYSSFKWHSRHFDSVDWVAKTWQNDIEFNDPLNKYIYRYLFNEEPYNPQLEIEMRHFLFPLYKQPE